MQKRRKHETCLTRIKKRKKTTFSPVESKLSTFILITLKGLIFMHIRNVEDNNEKKVIDFFPHNLQ